MSFDQPTIGSPTADTGRQCPEVPRVELAEERKRLGRLAEKPPPHVLIVSDLHLGLGADVNTGRIESTENFFSDEPFSAFLRYYARLDSPPGLLVLNGDTFDFVRIDVRPEGAVEMAEWVQTLARFGVNISARDLAASIGPRERRFGLGTGEHKSVWKLQRITRGHSRFVRALAAWIDAGGQVLFNKGNHDLELHWPLVRQAIRDVIQRTATVPVSDHVFFSEDDFQLTNLHMEHGHRYSDETRVIGSPVLPENPPELNLPWGSFMNRYLVNPIERLDPFLDNCKPVMSSLLSLLHRRPLASLNVLFHSWWFVLRVVRMRRFLAAGTVLVFLACLLLPVVVIAAAGVGLFLWLSARGNYHLPAWGPAFGVLGVLAPYAFGVIRELRPRRRPAIGEDGYAAGAYTSLIKHNPHATWTVLYAALGHTHCCDVQVLPDIGTCRVVYLNSGSWTHMWDESRPDLHGRILHTYLAFDWMDTSQYQDKVLLWDPSAEQPRDPYILRRS